MDKELREILATAGIKGDESALLQRIDADKHRLYGIAYSYMRNENDALEAVQETVCRVWVKRKTLRDPKYFTTWMIRILISVCMDERKKQKREPVTADDHLGLGLNDGAVEEAAERLDMSERIKQLSNPYRMVIVLKYYRDMTVMEIAELLEKPDGTIRTWLNKGLKLLRINMSDKEGKMDEYGRGQASGKLEEPVGAAK